MPSSAIAVSTLNDRPFLEVPANEARRRHGLMLPTEADKRFNALVAIYRQAGYGLDHCEGNLLENHPNLLQNCSHCNKSWGASTRTLPHVAHHRSRDLILRGDNATDSRRKQDTV
jgi:hypothetical protein